MLNDLIYHFGYVGELGIVFVVPEEANREADEIFIVFLVISFGTSQYLVAFTFIRAMLALKLVFVRMRFLK